MKDAIHTKTKSVRAIRSKFQRAIGDFKSFIWDKGIGELLSDLLVVILLQLLRYGVLGGYDSANIGSDTIAGGRAPLFSHKGGYLGLLPG